MKSMITSRKIYYMGKEHLIQATNEGGKMSVTEIFFYTFNKFAMTLVKNGSHYDNYPIYFIFTGQSLDFFCGGEKKEEFFLK